MHATPLQILLALTLVPHEVRVIGEAVVAVVLVLAAAALGRRSFVARGLIILAVGLAFDLLATPVAATSMGWAQWTGGFAIVLFCWGVIYLALATADAIAHRARTHFSTILKDLLMITLWGVVVLLVLRVDFHVNPSRLLASTAVIAAVIGFALQESLGNIFSGLSLQLSRPFAPGDWVRTGPYVGRVQGIGWRSTAIITRRNERLQIPNTLIAKDTVVGYSHGAVADEITLGLSYAAPPNYVHRVIVDALANMENVLAAPPPEVQTQEFADSAIRYRIRYWVVDYAQIEEIHNAVASSLWYVLRRHSIDIPHPTRTVHLVSERAAAAAAVSERELAEELRQVDFLRALNEQELRLLISGVTVQHFGAGEAIVREHQPGDSLFIIRSGTVEVLVSSGNGRPVHIRDLSRPAFFGEMALMTGEPRNATVCARTDAQLLEISRDTFARLFKAHPETVMQIGEVIAQRAIERRELLEALPSDTSTRRRTNWLLGKMRTAFNLGPPR